MPDQAEGLRRIAIEMGQLPPQTEQLADEGSVDLVPSVLRVEEGTDRPGLPVEARAGTEVKQEPVGTRQRQVKRIRQAKPAAAGTTRIISIASGKGGVGKSNLSVNLSIALADVGKKVLLLDADLGLANINILMGIIPKFNLFHVIKGEKKMSEIVLSVPEGIDIIAGASGFSDLANLNSDMRRKFIRNLNTFQNYDYIIIDTAAGVASNVLGFLRASDEVIIITTPEPTSITDAYGIIKAIVNDGYTNIRLVVNRIRNIMEGKKVSDRIIRICAQFLNVQISNLGYIPEDDALPRSVRGQEPFIRAFPSSKAAKSVAHIARVIENKTEQKKSSMKSFFRNFVKAVSG